MYSTNIKHKHKYAYITHFLFYKHFNINCYTISTLNKNKYYNFLLIIKAYKNVFEYLFCLKNISII